MFRVRKLFVAAVVVAASSLVAQPASASSGSFNCGPNRLKISTNLGPNPATITHKVNGATINSAYG